MNKIRAAKLMIVFAALVSFLLSVYLWLIRRRERGGTRCTDYVQYEVLGGWLIDLLTVRRDVRKVFAFRQAILREVFTPGPPRTESNDRQAMSVPLQVTRV